MAEKVGDMESKMFAALTNESGIAQPMQFVNLDEMIKYLKKYINTLSIADKKAVGRVLIQNDKENCLRLCEEGTAIHLDPLPTSIIEKMYNVMIDRRSRQQ